MIHFEREVVDYKLMNEMLKMFDTVHIAMNDNDGYPYVLPISYGYELTDTELTVFIHFMKKGKKVELFKNNPKVALAFSDFNDFPDRKYKGHYHDYRSVLAKGIITLLEYKDDPELWEKGYNLLYTCNNRDIKPLSDRKVIPNMYIGVIRCPLETVTAKSEFPLRTIEDVPFMNVYEKELDDTPFDISDIIQDRKARMKK